MSILNQIKEKPHAIAMLIDPEKVVNNLTVLKTLLDKAVISGIDFIFIGGNYGMTLRRLTSTFLLFLRLLKL